MRINTNIASLQAQRQSEIISRALARTLQRLSSGKRINSARDDAAGLAISENLRSQTRGLKAVSRNINDAFGYLNVADGALSSQIDIVQRMRELALQASQGTLSVTERSYLNSELETLYEEFDRIAQTADFNGTRLLDGTMGTLDIQVGVNKGETIALSSLDSRASGVFTTTTTMGTGNFSAPQTYQGQSQSLALYNQFQEDVTGDGYLDVITPQLNGVVGVQVNQGDGTFSALQTFAWGGVVFLHGAEDFNGDGLNDLYMKDDSNGNVFIRTSNGDGTFSRTATVNLGGAAPNAFQFLDFNGDGHLDIAAHSESNSYRVRLNNGDGTFASTVTTTLSSDHLITSGFEDYNGDGILDILSFDGLDEVDIRLGNGLGGFGSAQSLDTTGLQAYGASSADLNGDGHLDIYFQADLADNDIHYFLNDGLGNFGAKQILNFDAYTLGGVADINGDDVLDFYGSSGATFVTRLGSSSGSFTNGATLTAAGASAWIAPTDLNGDGHLDALAVAGTSLSSFLNQGGGSFGAAIASTQSASTTPGTIQDYNNDGFIDLISGNDLLLGDGNGRFTAFAQYNPGVGFGTGFFDFDNDGIFERYIGASLSGQFSLSFQNTTTESNAMTPSVNSQAEAEDLLDILDSALERLLDKRSQIGAAQNRLEASLATTLVTYENLEQARSQMLDADFAVESAELSKLLILQQASVAVMGQANFSLRIVLELLEDRRRS